MQLPMQSTFTLTDISVDAVGRPVPHLETDPGYDKLTSAGAGEYILEHVPETWQRMMQTNYSNGIERDAEKLAANDLDQTKWANPLEVRYVRFLSDSSRPSNGILACPFRLPNAPSMKIYCVYGHGKDTEVSNPIGPFRISLSVFQNLVFSQRAYWFVSLTPITTTIISLSSSLIHPSGMLVESSIGICPLQINRTRNA